MMTVRLSATIPTNKHNCWGRLYWRTLPTTKVWHPKATTSGLRRNLLAWRCWGQPTGNFGTLTNGALEASNVDLSKELVNMIVAQRNYQSNAQTIKTQDQILNTLVNLR